MAWELWYFFLGAFCHWNSRNISELFSNNASENGIWYWNYNNFELLSFLFSFSVQNEICKKQKLSSREKQKIAKNPEEKSESSYK